MDESKISLVVANTIRFSNREQNYLIKSIDSHKFSHNTQIIILIIIIYRNAHIIYQICIRILIYH